MTVELIHVDLEEKPVFSNLMQHYRHDLSEFIDIVVNHEGLFDLGPYFDLYWTESTRHPFFVFDDGASVGFALAREYESACYEVAEFFILRKHRRKGAGTAAALALFRRFKGRWRVAQDAGNSPAQAFWRKVVGQFSGGDFQEGWSDQQPRGPMQTFLSTSY